MTKDEIIQINRMRIAGDGYGTIAKATGINLNTIKSWCRRHPLSETDHLDEQHRCKQCGKEVIQNEGRKEKKFCSDGCRAKWWNSHLDLVNRKAYHSHICPACGNSFSVYGIKTRKYCTRGCYFADRYKSANYQTYYGGNV